MTETKEQVQTEVVTNKPFVLILHNDDYNSFDGVISALITFCDHTAEQAEQVANIVHYVGKCDVKHGDKETITKIYNQLKGNGLTVTMES
jgi:ATP-dependent Clp protease adaptor protein ClpS